MVQCLSWNYPNAAYVFFSVLLLSFQADESSASNEYTWQSCTDASDCDYAACDRTVLDSTSQCYYSVPSQNVACDQVYQEIGAQGSNYCLSGVWPSGGNPGKCSNVFPYPAPICVRPPNCQASPGYYCPDLRSRANGIKCPIGHWCGGGTADKVQCNTSTGYFCPEGSSSGTGIVCPDGYYCVGGSADKALRTWQSCDSDSDCKPCGSYDPKTMCYFGLECANVRQLIESSGLKFCITDAYRNIDGITGSCKSNGPYGMCPNSTGRMQITTSFSNRATSSSSQNAQIITMAIPSLAQITTAISLFNGTSSGTAPSSLEATSSFPTSAIIGVAIGGVAVCILIGSIWFVFRRAQSSPEPNKSAFAQDPAHEISVVDIGTGPKLLNQDASSSNVELSFQMKNSSGIKLSTVRDQVFSDTFLSGTEAAFSCFVQLGQEIPLVGNIFNILQKIKEQVDVYCDVEEECVRMSVWCEGVFACLGKIFQNGATQQGPGTILLEQVREGLEDLHELIQSRLSLSKGVLGRLYAFGSASGYKDKMNSVQTFLQKAMDALLLNVSAEIREDVVKVVKATELLPQMDRKIDDILHGLKLLTKSVDVIDSKMDRLLDEKQRKSEKDIKRDTHARIVSSFSLPSSRLKMKESHFAEGGSSKVYIATYSGLNVAVKVQSLAGANAKKLKTVLENFEKEMGILCQLSHPNILRVYGSCTDVPGQLMLVMELAQV
jgi:hypothetical protein